MSTFEEALEAAVKAAVLRAHPVGSYFITESADNPAEIFGGGVWQKLEGRVLLGTSSSYSLGTEGGEVNHTHKYGIRYGGYYQETILENISNGGALKHGSSSEGGAGATNTLSGTIKANGSTTKASSEVSSNLYDSIADTSITSNLPPYRAVNIWRRTA